MSENRRMEIKELSTLVCFGADFDMTVFCLTFHTKMIKNAVIKQRLLKVVSKVEIIENALFSVWTGENLCLKML